MMRLPTGMAAVYGDFEFGSTTETTALNITPVYDTSEADGHSLVYSITLKTHLAADTIEELDVLVREARAG